MSDINNVVLIGRLTKDCQVSKTKSGKSVSTFSLAVEKRPDSQGNKSADFISCIAWEKRADFLGNYGRKGTKVGISGRLATSNYDDKQTGRKVYRTDVIADEVELLAYPQNSGNNQTAQQNQNNYQNQYTQPSQNTQQTAMQNNYGAQNIDSSDLPF